MDSRLIGVLTFLGLTTLALFFMSGNGMEDESGSENLKPIVAVSKTTLFYHWSDEQLCSKYKSNEQVREAALKRGLDCVWTERDLVFGAHNSVDEWREIDGLCDVSKKKCALLDQYEAIRCEVPDNPFAGVEDFFLNKKRTHVLRPFFKQESIWFEVKPLKKAANQFQWLRDSENVGYGSYYYDEETQILVRKRFYSTDGFDCENKKDPQSLLSGMFQELLEVRLPVFGLERNTATQELVYKDTDFLPLINTGGDTQSDWPHVIDLKYNSYNIFQNSTHLLTGLNFDTKNIEEDITVLPKLETNLDNKVCGALLSSYEKVLFSGKNVDGVLQHLKVLDFEQSSWLQTDENMSGVYEAAAKTNFGELEVIHEFHKDNWSLVPVIYDSKLRIKKFGSSEWIKVTDSPFAKIQVELDASAEPEDFNKLSHRFIGTGGQYWGYYQQFVPAALLSSGDKNYIIALADKYCIGVGGCSGASKKRVVLFELGHVAQKGATAAEISMKELCTISYDIDATAILPSLTELQAALNSMMGVQDSCNYHQTNGLAWKDKYETLRRKSQQMVTPWVPARLISEKERKRVDKNIHSWGRAGPWELSVYMNYLDLKPQVEKEIAKLYIDGLGFSDSDANAYATNAIYNWLVTVFGYSGEEGFGRIPEKPPEKLKIGCGVKTYGCEPNELANALYNPDELMRLLEQGIPPDTTNAFGKTALMYAAQLNQPTAAEILLRYGADPSLRTFDTNKLRDEGLIGWSPDIERPFGSGCYVIAKTRDASQYANENGSKEVLELLSRSETLSSQLIAPSLLPTMSMSTTTSVSLDTCPSLEKIGEYDEDIGVFYPPSLANKNFDSYSAEELCNNADIPGYCQAAALRGIRC